MADIPITIASGDYDRTRALKDGTVRVEGCAVAYANVEPNELFKRNLRAPEFDVSEMSFSTYIVQCEQNKAAYTAIPVFLSRAFRHSAIFVRTDRISTPADLKGKRIGTPEYFTTMLVWLRGLLSDEYGVKPSDLRWYIGGQEQPAKEPPVLSTPEARIDIEAIPTGKTLSAMLADGEIDALFSARPPSCFQRAPNIARLFPDYRTTEQAYYKKTGIYPLMHAVGIRNSLVKPYPQLPAALYTAFLAAKQRALADLERLSAFAVTLPWMEAEYRATQAVLGPDIWPYGIAANTKAIDTLCRYLHEQGFTKRVMKADDLFAPISVGSQPG